MGKAGLRCAALLYHHVGPLYPGMNTSLTLSPERFERQVGWLARKGYVGIRPSDWLRWRSGEADLPEKPILLTFDDAYADTAEHALPVLCQHGFGAAVYVVTQRLGATNTWDDPGKVGMLRLMSAEQIQYWAAKGIEFGAHTRTHADLTRLSAAECLDEIAGSRSDLSAVLGCPVTSFAYPFGLYNNTACKLVRGEYELAFSVKEGLNTIHTDPHLLRRAYIGPNDPLFEFAFKVRRGAGLAWAQGIRSKLAVRTRLKKLFGRDARE